jgi:predicted aminopeptidase
MWVRRVLLTLAAVASVAVAYLVLTPTGRYLLRGAWEESKILLRRRPLADILADSATTPALRAKLELVLGARAFARDSLGLDVGKSFTTYSETGHDTLTLVVSGAYRDRLKAYTWWFPVVGRVPYKGFFAFDRATRDAAAMRGAGYDAYVRPSPAFSTLGWFNDPLLNTTLHEDRVDLANTVVHELTHNTFYAPGQAAFNESFASFVGARGSAWLFRSRGDTAAAAEADRRWAQEVRLAAFWTALGAAIDSAYAAHRADSTGRVAARDSVYARARVELVQHIAPAVGAPAAWASRVQLDNAALLARLTYGEGLPLFDAAWEREGRDVRRAVARVVALARGRPDDPFGALRAFVGASR